MKEDEFLKKQIKNLNTHLPKERNTLEKLLDMEKPRVTNRDGSKYRFKKSELNYLSEILSEKEYPKLRLPIMIRVSPQLGRGTSKITGKIEKKVISEILDKEKEDEEELLIYRPETRKIRKKLPTTTQYVFMISGGR